jgi:hypothetical protein
MIVRSPVFLLVASFLLVAVAAQAQVGDNN